MKFEKRASNSFASRFACGLAALSLAACSQSGLAEPQEGDEANVAELDSALFGGSAADARHANRKFCGPGSRNKKLNLAGVALQRQAGISLQYSGFNNVEGPLWHDGALYYTNMGNHPPDASGFVLSNQTTLWRWEPGGTAQVWLDDSVAGTNGLAVDFDGRLVAARQLDGSLSRIDWASKAITPIVNEWEDKRFNSPNDLTIAHDGTIYFTDPNWNTPSNVDPSTVQGGGEPGSLAPGQRIYRVGNDGVVWPLVATELVPELRDKPNGIMLSLDETELWIGSLRGLWAFDLVHGQVQNPRQLLNTPIDGLGKDCAGNIYVTTTRPIAGRVDGQVIAVLSPSYQELGYLVVPRIHITTNVAFGGDEGRTLYVTGLTAELNDQGTGPRMCGQETCLPAGVYAARLNVSGFPY
jgi:gluconolactonase